MLSLVRPGCLFFCRSGHPVVTVDQFLDFLGFFFLRSLILIFPGFRGGICGMLHRLNSLRLVDWMVGLGMRLRLGLFLGSLVLPFCVGAG